MPGLLPRFGTVRRPEGGETPLTEPSMQDPYTPRTQGACYGFEIRSTLPFRYLRSGKGVPLSVEETEDDLSRDPGELLQTWSPIPGRRALIEVYGHAEGHTVRIGEAAPHWFRLASDDTTIRVSSTPDVLYREMLLWTTPITVAAVPAGALALHASAVDLDGGSVLLAAPSGSGKTTTATAFLQRGLRVLSEDLTCCRVESGIGILPGPGLVKLRHDVKTLLSSEALSPVLETPEKAHYAIAPELRGTGDPVPLRAMVFLAVHDGAVELREVSPAQALRDLWAMSFYLPDDQSRGRCFEGLGRLVAGVPTYRLARRLDPESLEATLDTLVERFGG